MALNTLSEDLFASFDLFLSQNLDEALRSELLTSNNNELKNEIEKISKENALLYDKLINKGNEFIDLNEKYNIIVLRLNEIIIDNDKEHNARATVVKICYDVIYISFDL